MEYYEVLICATVVIAGLAASLWVRTRDLSILLGIATMYFWSLYGAWAIIGDKLEGSSGHYAYLEAKMFALQLDDSYLLTILFYGLFIAVVEMTVLLSVRPGCPHDGPAPSMRVAHGYLLVFAVLAGTVSWLIERPYLGRAIDLGWSGYKATRDTGPYLTVYEVLNESALVALAIGYATLCSGRRPRLMAGDRRVWTGPAYLAAIAGMYGFNFALGNKHPLLIAGLTGLLLYLRNVRQLRAVPIAAAVTLGMSGLWLIDNYRYYPLAQVTAQLSNLDFSSLLGDSYGLASASTEQFAAHFSMYGVLAHHVEPLLGQSLVSLAASMVPRLLWANRPPDIYPYYASAVGAVTGQGYTIHHATGWYLNFGVLGVPLGGIVAGVLWSACLKAHAQRSPLDSRWRLAFRTLAPCLFAAFMPTLIRAGIESYKALLFEGLLIPVAIVAVADPQLGWKGVGTRWRSHRQKVKASALSGAHQAHPRYGVGGFGLK
jgi:hypothetical protein